VGLHGLKSLHGLLADLLRVVDLLDLELKKILDPAMFSFSFSAEFLSVRRAFCVAVQLRQKKLYHNNSFSFLNSKVCRRLPKKLPMVKKRSKM
jgi:hypothetical protein